MRKVVRVFDGYCMRLVSGVNFQKLGRLIDGHVIHPTLHRAKEMVVKVGDIYRLVYHQVKHLTCSQIVMGDYSANGSIGLCPKGWVIPHNLYWLIIV